MERLDASFHLDAVQLLTVGRNDGCYPWDLIRFTLSCIVCPLSDGVGCSMSGRVGLSVEVPPSGDGSVVEKRTERDGETGLKSNQGSNGENNVNTPQKTHKRNLRVPDQSPDVSCNSHLDCCLLNLFLRLPGEVISCAAQKNCCC